MLYEQLVMCVCVSECVCTREGEKLFKLVSSIMQPLVQCFFAINGIKHIPIASPVWLKVAIICPFERITRTQVVRQRDTLA